MPTANHSLDIYHDDEDIILGAEPKSQLDDSTGWHTLINSCTIDEIHRKMSVLNTADFCIALLEKNDSGETLMEAANENMKRYLTWLKSMKENEFYEVYGNPRVLVMCYDRGSGSQQELNEIKKTMPIFSIEPLIYEGCSRDRVLGLIEAQANDERISGLVVIIATHGMYGHLHLKDGIGVSIQEVIDAMCSEQMTNNPKLLIIQACQVVKSSVHEPSSRSDRHSPDAAPTNPTIKYEYSIRNQADMMIIIASATGGLAFGNTMIPLLLKKIRENGVYEDVNTRLRLLFKKLSSGIQGKFQKFVLRWIKILL